MSDTVTIRGNLGTDVTTGVTESGLAFANFRLPSSERYRDRDTGAWRDGHTNWYNVKAFKRLAQNIGCSLRKGDPVVVTGKLRLREWIDQQGTTRIAVDLHADAIGPDLNFVTAKFAKSGQSRGDEWAAGPGNAGDPPTGPLGDAGGQSQDMSRDIDETMVADASAFMDPDDDGEGSGTARDELQEAPF